CVPPPAARAPRRPPTHLRKARARPAWRGLSCRVGNGFAVAHPDRRCGSHDDIAIWRNEIIAFRFWGEPLGSTGGKGEAAVTHPTCLRRVVGGPRPEERHRLSEARAGGASRRARAGTHLEDAVWMHEAAPILRDAGCARSSG